MCAFSLEADLVLARDGEALAEIVVPKNAPLYTQAAARRLSDYLQQVTGARFKVTNDAASVANGKRIWVGYQPEIAKHFPGKDLALEKPEEIVILATDDDLVIMGRDGMAEGVQVEAGTYHAVSTFLQDHLNIRWFWPGPLGSDVPKQNNLSFAPFSYRYHPPLSWRMLPMETFERKRDRLANKADLDAIITDGKMKEWTAAKGAAVREWMNHQRAHTKAEQPLAGTMNYWGSHYFNKREWWKRFGAEHPEWFALQPDGTRTPFPDGLTVKLCVSNPGVARQWLKEATLSLEGNPLSRMMAASENDRGWQGYCICAECLAMDNKEGPMLPNDLIWATEKKPFYSLTDRYVKFWNGLAVGLRERFPNRDVNVSVWAYHATNPPPTVPLEKNIIVGYVGIERRFYQENHMEGVLKGREIWKKWWEAIGKRNMLIWRPNLMARDAAGLPYVFMHRHAENMRFMADHGLGGMHLNSLTNHWAAQGPQHYVTAQMAWNPYLDVDQLLKDYYKRAFGAAAPHLQEYYTLFENRYRLLAEQYKNVPFSLYGDPPKYFREMRTDGLVGTARLGTEGIPRTLDLEKEAARCLELAREKLPDPESPERKRVEFVAVGFAFLQAHLDCIEGLNDLREKKGDPKVNRVKVADAVRRRYTVLKENQGTFSIDLLDVVKKTEEHPDYLGPLLPSLKQGVEPNAPAMDEKALHQDLEA